MRSFSIINGLMLGFAFGTAGLALLVTNLAESSLPDEIGRPAFARLIRSEKKTFFGYDHYYFTCMLRSGSEERLFTEAVRSDLYHLKREGDNVEILLLGDRIRLRSNDLSRRPPLELPLFWISTAFTLVGLGLLLIPAFAETLSTRMKTQTTPENRV